MAEKEKISETKQPAVKESGTKTGSETAANSQNQESNGAASDSIKETINKAKETAGQAAQQVAGKAQEKASEMIGGQKTNLAAGISSVAESVRHIGENLKSGDEKNQIAAFAGQYGDSLAKQIEQLSHYVEDKDFREIARDAEQLARRNPTLFVSGAFVLGILAARIFKSSGRTNGRRRISFSGSGSSSANATAQAS